MRKNGCASVGNTEMYYAAFGRGQKKLVVLPGLSDGLTTVKGKAWFLASSYRRFFTDYTLYMYKKKNKMPEGYTIRDMANDQVQAMKSIGIDQAYVMGVSQGGMIAQYMAIDHPEMVKKLILAVTAPNANDVVKDAVGTWIGMAKAGDHVALMADTAGKMYSKAYLEKHEKLFSLMAKFTKPKDYDRFLKNAYAILAFDAREELSKIIAPTYIIAGSEDCTVGNDAAHELNRGIAGSQLFVYEGLGHGAFEEVKDFYDRVLAFCNQ